MSYVRKWIHVQDGQSAVQLLNTIKAEKQILLGDFVKAIMKINNIVEQFMFICEETNDLEFLTVLKQVPEQTLKFIVTNQSLYI